MKKLVVLACGLLLLPGVALAADVYKWKDADGRVRYSDIPPGGKIPFEKVIGRKISAPAETPVVAKDAPEAADPKAQKAADPAADKELDAKKRKAEEDNLKKKEQAKLESQKVSEQNCANAKASLQNYRQGGRIYKIDEKGERVYLDENEIAAGLEAANKEVEHWCNAQ